MTSVFGRNVYILSRICVGHLRYIFRKYFIDTKEDYVRYRIKLMNWLNLLLPHLDCCACCQCMLHFHSTSSASVCFIATLAYRRRYLVKCVYFDSFIVMKFYVCSVQHVVSLLFASLCYFLITRLMFLMFFLCLFCCCLCLLSLLCILWFCVVLCVVSPFVLSLSYFVLVY